MNKLRKKVFYTIFIILTLSILSFIVVFNTQKYIEKKNSINNSLNVASNNHRPDNLNNPPIKPTNEVNKEDVIPDENTKFMDFTIYTILIDEDNNIKEIINHSNSIIEEEKINELANNILNKKNIKNKYIGFLYLDNYSYTYIKNNSLVILDNGNIKQSLLNSLYTSIIIFIILEILVYLISKQITSWIIKPVEESFIKQKQFIEDASHELKTPLSVIISSTEILEENKNEQKWIDNIKRESERMNILIQKLLELSKTEYKETFKLENNNLSKIIELSILTFEGKAYENNIKLKYNIEDNINILCDENSIKELIEILLDNAIKHSNINSTICVNLVKSYNNVILTVQNEGDEIDPSEEEKIFERFYRVDKARNRSEGRFGLGLAIAKNIVINHNGVISAKSSNGTTTFEVLFKK